MEFEDFDFITSEAPARASEPADPLQRLKYLVDNTPAIIYSTVPSGDFKMTFVSANALNVLGYRPAEMVADPNFWFDHIHPDDAPNIFSSLAQIFTEGEKAYEYRFRTADGRYLWMHDKLRLIRDEQGAPLEVIGSLTDITDRKEMEETLLQAQNMASIGQLAAGVAHEINNPVGFVTSNIGTLKSYADTLFELVEHSATAEQRSQADFDFMKEDTAALLRESMDGLHRVRDIVQALKDFSELGESHWQQTDVHEGLDGTLHSLANELRFKAKVDKHYGKLPPVHGLPGQLNQVFRNILLNAIQALPAQGIIRIVTGADREGVHVRIQDNGVGIPPENLGRIFDPFFTTKPVGSGTGLGLYLAYGIVSKHGGRINVISEPGKGSAFTVYLPLRSAEPR
ncbi:ATP-binding protein [Duganella sp. Root198D2]|uniref:PAS domain-containing sensor histidine kinase n=1 Tax=Duganella sp. Root198D2 TaxID=1736489 RepID=UPI000709036E|nr:ATP-binding protein [Duganella sp. Root198D2]KRC02366.1 PAS domain-containing sensor histidine kinase [Duganella sp. Root198D2]